MTRNDIKRKIAELIGRTFLEFGEYKTKEGTELRVEGEKFEVGKPIYVITPEGQLPVSDGDYEIEDGTKIKVKAGLITNVEETDKDETELEKDDKEKEDEEKMNFDEAELIDGTIVGTEGDFEVGKKLYVKTDEGKFVDAPEGSHTTKSGIEVVVNGESVITGLKAPDKEGEGTLEEMMEQFTSVLETLTKQIVDLKKEQSLMNKKFSKLGDEPAGDKVYDRKGYLSDIQKNQFSKLDAMAALKNKNK